MIRFWNKIAMFHFLEKCYSTEISIHHTSAKIVLSNNFTFPPRFEMKFRIYFAPQNHAELIESESVKIFNLYFKGFFKMLLTLSAQYQTKSNQ